MKKILLTAFIAAVYITAHAQITDTTRSISDTIRQEIKSSPTPKNWKNIDLSNRSNDHLMIQYGFKRLIKHYVHIKMSGETMWLNTIGNRPPIIKTILYHQVIV